ncbi:hypothetical protein RIF29_20222 [Crotalaria pallida]|uniref:Ubiquitin-like protease family profile domain-containing protein n=1 Tax=Crotalaria pallida TaxID=3830 RepID=A0AAN9F255_CROPI
MLSSEGATPVFTMTGIRAMNKYGDSVELLFIPTHLEEKHRLPGRRSLDSPEQCSTPTIGSPSSLTSMMARSNRFLEGVILGSTITMGVDEITKSIVGEIASSIDTEGRQSLEKDQESVNAALKVLEYVVYCKSDGSIDRGCATSGVEHLDPMSSDKLRDKGKAIAKECGVENGLTKRIGLIQDISSTEERMGEEHNPGLLFPLSDAEDDFLQIDENMSTPKPSKIRQTKQHHRLETVRIGKFEKSEDWNDLVGSNMMGTNESFIPAEETPIRGGSTAKKRGRPSGSSSGKSKTPRGRLNSFPFASLDKPKGHIFPLGVRGTFKSKPEFDLTWAEMRMAGYIEMLLKIGDVSANRRDLECLLPNNFIDEKAAALNDRPLEEIVQDHSKPWMPFAYPLKLIYVPLVEGTVHWYLMVIDFSTKKVYKMDVFDSPQSLGWKHADMKVVCKVLEKVISSAEYVEEMWTTPHDFSSWEFKELEEDKTRMQTAVKLILGHFNELKATVEAKTRNTWTNLPI